MLDLAIHFILTISTSSVYTIYLPQHKYIVQWGNQNRLKAEVNGMDIVLFRVNVMQKALERLFYERNHLRCLGKIPQ
jgi:hypothetical protein